MTWPTTRPGEQVPDLPLQHIIGRQPDRVAHPAALQSLVDLGPSKRGVRPDHGPLPAQAIPINDGQQDLVPAVRTVDVAWATFRGEAVALRVEDEERVIADGLEVTSAALRLR